jgi:hypothetical protein
LVEALSDGAARAFARDRQVAAAPVIRPAGGSLLGAFRTAAMHEHHVRMLDVDLVERGPDALVIGVVYAAGESDLRAFGQQQLGFSSVSAIPKQPAPASLPLLPGASLLPPGSDRLICSMLWRPFILKNSSIFASGSLVHSNTAYMRRQHFGLQNQLHTSAPAFFGDRESNIIVIIANSVC